LKEDAKNEKRRESSLGIKKRKEGEGTKKTEDTVGFQRERGRDKQSHHFRVGKKGKEGGAVWLAEAVNDTSLKRGRFQGVRKKRLGGRRRF